MKIRHWMLSLLVVLALGCKNKGGSHDVKEELGTPDMHDQIKEDMRPAEHVVVFTLDWGGQAVPLACWDDKQHKLRKEGECLGLVPPGDTDLALASGRSTTMGTEQTVVCEPSGDEVPGLATQITESGGPDFGVWPASKLKTVQIHAKNPGAPKPIQVSAEETAKLKKTIQRVAEKATGNPEVLQKLALDVDGDGKKDTLYSVMVKNADAEVDDEMMYAFAGLILYAGTDPSKGQILTGSQWELPIVMATMDLDQNKTVEMVIYSSYYEGEAMTVEQIVNGKLETVGGWGCGA